MHIDKSLCIKLPKYEVLTLFCCFVDLCRIKALGNLGTPDISLTVSGVCHLNGNLYVVLLNYNNITVYSAKSGATFEDQLPVKVIAVNGMIGPVDIVTSFTLQRLYVADSFGVWRLKANLDDDHNTADQDTKLWLQAKGVKSLSVAVGGKLMVTEHESLRMFSSNLELIFEINLDSCGLTKVQHAFETSSGTLIVCQADIHEKGIHRIVEINNSGVVLRTCSGIAGIGCLSGPHHADEDAERGWVFVPDFSTHQVLLFDRKLNLQGVLVKSKGDLFKKVCYVKELKLLLLCKVFGSVDVYRVYP